MKTSHSKGKWIIKKDNTIVSKDNQGCLIAQICSANNNETEQKANGQLITFAPELLEFVMRMVSESNFMDEQDKEEAIQLIEKVTETDTPMDSYKGNNPMVVLNHLLGYLNDHQKADAKSLNLQGNNTHLLGYLSEEQWEDAKKIIPKDCHKHLLRFATDVDNAYQTSFKDIINQEN